MSLKLTRKLFFLIAAATATGYSIRKEVKSEDVNEMRNILRKMLEKRTIGIVSYDLCKCHYDL